MLEPLMDSLLLLRSFGDFVIAINAAQYAAPKSQKKLVASIHLQELYEAIKPYLANQHIPIEFVDLGIVRPLFSAFTNKHLFTLQSLKELSALKNLLENNSNQNLLGVAVKTHNRNLIVNETDDFKYATINKSILFLEQKRRLSLLGLYTHQTFKPIHSSGNIYNSYQFQFGNIISANTDTGFQYAKKILVFPDSRMQKKALPNSWLVELSQGLSNTNKTIEIARFDNNPLLEKIKYKNFNELVALILNADAIISSDSLPAHLAQLLHKPHAIIYANTINKEWITPFAHQQRTGFLLNQMQALLTLINVH